MDFPRARIEIDTREDPGPRARRAVAFVRPGGAIALAKHVPHDRSWWSDDGPRPATVAAADAWREAVCEAAQARGVSVVDTLDGPPSVVVAPEDVAWERVSAAWDEGCPLALLSSGSSTDQASVGLLAWGDPRHLRPAAAWLAGTAGPELTLIRIGSPDPPVRPDELAELLGWPRVPTLHHLGEGLLEGAARLEPWLREHPMDCLVTGLPSGLAVAALRRWLEPLPTDLVCVPSQASWWSGWSRLELTEAVRLGDTARAQAVQIDAAGLVWEPPDGTFAVQAGGVVLGSATLTRGQVVLGDVGGHAVVGLSTEGSRPLATLEASTRVLLPEGAPIVLVGSDPDPSRVETARAAGHRVWAWMDEPVSPSAVRRRCGADAVLSAGAVLDDGTPRDRPDRARESMTLRLRRALAAAGYPMVLEDGSVSRPPATLGGRLALRAQAVPTSVRRWSVYDDNRETRQAMLADVDGARHHIALQSYMVEDDAVGREVARALADAAGRGVSVRILVDSLWSLHGSLSQDNPMLSRLEAVDGVTVRAFRPVEDLDDLKARNHRKLLVVDGAVAWLHGRNLSSHYLLGFDEIDLTPETDQAEVPWFDLSTRLEGPVVQQALATFDAAWEGRRAWDGQPPPRTEASDRAWWITHDSLTDTFSLDAMRVLIDAAEQEIVLATTFMLQLELQHALLRRLEEGLTVRILTGHVRPWRNGGRHPFPGKPSRDMMTALVHGRLDPLVDAGAEVVAAAVREPRWTSAVGTVWPHVHTKLWLIDRRVAMLGSANPDLSSAYWEAEASLVIDDAAGLASLVERVERWLTEGERFDVDDPTWQRKAAQRQGVSARWPSLLS